MREFFTRESMRDGKGQFRTRSAIADDGLPKAWGLEAGALQQVGPFSDKLLDRTDG